MGWEVRNEPEHFCDLPKISEAGVGSIWSCDKEDCGKKYKIIKSVQGPQWTSWGRP